MNADDNDYWLTVVWQRVGCVGVTAGCVGVSGCEERGRTRELQRVHLGRASRGFQYDTM